MLAQSLSSISASYRTLVLSSSSHGRPSELVDAAAVPIVPLAGEALLAGPADALLADHAGDLFVLDQAVDTRDPLVGSDSGKLLQGFKILVDHYYRGLLLFYGNLLPLKCLNGIHNTIGDNRVENIYQILFVWQTVTVTIGEILRD